MYWVTVHRTVISIWHWTYYSLTILTGTQLIYLRRLRQWIENRRFYCPQKWNCNLYLTLIWGHVKCTASQNPSHQTKHIFNWSYFQVLFTVIYSSVLILLKKAKMSEPYEETCYLWTRSGIRFRFTWERYSLGPKITRVESATDTKSDRSEFVFRPVPCKRIKRNVYMESDTNSYQSKFFPVSCIYPTLFSSTWPFASVWQMKGAVSRQSSSFCLILPITRPQSLWNLK